MNKKTKILFINGHLDVGGCERSLVDLLKNINYGKYEVDLLLLEHLGDYINEVPEKVNVILYSLDHAFGKWTSCLLAAVKKHDWFSFFFRIYYMLGMKVNKYFFRQLRKLFRKLKHNYDIVIAYRPGICTELAAFTFQAAKKISWWHHGCMNLDENSIALLDKAYQRIDFIVVVSLSSALLLTKNFPNVKSKISVIPNMVIAVDLHYKANRYVPKEFQNAKFKIVSVGRMVPEKNMSLCPYVAENLKKKGIDFRWILVGDGSEMSTVSSLINKLHLESNMLTVGKKSNPYPYIADADLMVHPSLVESQGITILESMALETPVIAVISDGPKEFIKTGINGYLTQDNVTEIAQIIELLYQNKALRVTIAENALTDVRQFGNEEIMNKFERLLGGIKS